MKTETKKNAISNKKAAASKLQTNDKILWVWKLTWEDINECGHGSKVMIEY